jgi:hypothetical protein
MDEYLRRLVRYGEEEDFDKLPIRNAVCLAEGSLPLVVVLEEPCASADWFDYDTMVWGDEDANENTLRHDGSATLQEVDSLIREASDERYDLQDISVFDLNTLLSQNYETSESCLDKAHKCFWDMIKAKRPKAIVVMTTTAKKSNHKSVRLLWSSRYDTTKSTDITLPGAPGKVTIIRGYHPSAYLREAYAATWLRDEEDEILARHMLRICFSKALTVIEPEVYNDIRVQDAIERWHEVLEGIREKCQKRQSDKKPTGNHGIAVSQETDLPDMTRLTIHEG